MKLEDLRKAACLADEAKKLQHLIDAVLNDGLQVTIASTYQDDEMRNAIKPVITAELDRRITKIRSELSALGVSEFPNWMDNIPIESPPTKTEHEQNL
ncbi:MAG: hypothetical protein QNI84_13205 [Henriciella sp.]|nr:hypothetical protein [Henriciella sp.]